METEYIRIIKDKNGEFDFRVSGNITKITPDELKDFRSIVITSIYVAEMMWRNYQEQLPENVAMSNSSAN